MKRLFRVLSYATLVALVFSCSSKEDGLFVPAQKDNTIITVSASVESSPTKTTLQDDLSIIWNAEDAISLLASGVNYEFKTSSAKLKDGGLRANFDHEGEIPQQSYYAIYPFNSGALLNGSVITTQLPAIQTAAANSFGPGANLAVAYADWGQPFKFRNAAAMIKVSFKTTDADAAIKSITFRSLNSSILLSGTVQLTPTVEDGVVTNVAMTVTSGQPYVTLQAPDGQYLQPNTEYYITAAPAALTSGYRIEFETADGLTFGRDYSDATYKSAVLSRNTISATGKKNLDNFEITGYFRVRYAETNNHPGIGEYLVVYKMPDGSYRILNEDKTDTYIVKGTHFALSGSQMINVLSQTLTDVGKQELERMVAFVFRNAWLSSSNSDDNISFADDELITSTSPIGISVNRYRYNSKYYYFANVVLYNRTDNTNITLTLDNLTCKLNSSDSGTVDGLFNTNTSSVNPQGNPNSCSDLVNALMMHATFSVPIFGDQTATVKKGATDALKKDNAFSGAFTTASHNTLEGKPTYEVYKDHFMIRTNDLLSGASLSDIWIYKHGTKNYAYYINNK